MDLVKNYEVCETLISLQVNKLTYYGFMDVGRKLKTETKDFITHINNSSPQHFPESYRRVKRGPGVTGTHSKLHYRGGILS